MLWMPRTCQRHYPDSEHSLIPAPRDQNRIQRNTYPQGAQTDCAALKSKLSFATKGITNGRSVLAYVGGTFIVPEFLAA